MLQHSTVIHDEVIILKLPHSVKIYLSSISLILNHKSFSKRNSQIISNPTTVWQVGTRMTDKTDPCNKIILISKVFEVANKNSKELTGIGTHIQTALNMCIWA